VIELAKPVIVIGAAVLIEKQPLSTLRLSLCQLEACYRSFILILRHH
jgi:hypothetical protein